jgi:hypothetical protein
MRFVSFIKKLPPVTDSDLHAFVTWVKKTQGFPLSSDPAYLIIFLHNKLNEEQTIGFKKALLLYSVEPKNMMSKELKDKENLLRAVNLIDAWQNKQGE